MVIATSQAALCLCPTTQTPRSRTNGFSLIELTIVMTISGLLLAAAASLYDIHQKKRRVELTTEHIQSAQASILEYARSNGFYPCPAPIDAAIDTPEYATAADCSASSPSSGIGQANGRGGRKVWVGALPTRTLGASSTLALDGWNQRLFYGVSKNLTVPNGGINQDDGAIKIIDGNDNIVADGTAHYVLLSVGPDGKGAYSAQGGLIATCASAAGKDQGNCQLNTSTFRATENRATIEGANHFDDFVAHAIDLEISNGIPPGGIMAFDSTNCPAGWEPLSGLEGRVILGTGTLGSDTYALGNVGGAAHRNMAIANLPPHNHRSTINPPASPTTYSGNHTHSASIATRIHPSIVSESDPVRVSRGRSKYETSSNPLTISAAGNHAHTVNIPPFTAISDNTGSGQPFDNRPPYRAFLYCKKL